MRRSILLLSLAIVMAFACAGCGDDEPSKPSNTGSIAGTITDIDSGLPVTDAAVAIVDPASMTTRSALVRVDAQGRFSEAGLAPGRYSVFVYHMNRVIFDRDTGYARVEGGKTTTFDMRLVDSEIWNGVPRVVGVVRDADTGAPIPGAYVADALLGLFQGTEVWAPLIGINVPDWAMTDASGRFAVETMVWTDEDGGPEGLSPVTAAKSGYVPNTLAGEAEPPPPVDPGSFSEFPTPLPMPAEGESVLTVEIRLHKLPAGGLPPGETGAVKGRLIFIDEPVAGLGVAAAIAWTSDRDTLHGRRSPAVPVPGATAVTDATGRFVISKLVPGFYSLAPGYLPDDGYTADDLSDDISQIMVLAGLTTDLGDIRVLRAIRAVAPADRAHINDTTPLLSWTAPQLNSGYTVDHYRVWYSDEYVQRNSFEVTGTSWQFPDSLAFVHGGHGRWDVDAFGTGPGAEGTPVRVAIFERAATFTVE